MEAGQWVPSEAVGIGAVVAAVFVEAVDVAVADVAVAGVAAAVAAAVVAPQLESYVGACVPVGTAHFWVLLRADNPVSRKLIDVEIC